MHYVEKNAILHLSIFLLALHLIQCLLVLFLVLKCLLKEISTTESVCLGIQRVYAIKINNKVWDGIVFVQLAITTLARGTVMPMFILQMLLTLHFQNTLIMILTE